MTCPKCNGSKRIILQLGVTGSSVGIEADCDECKGMGEVKVPGVCPTCNGSKKTLSPLGLSSGGSVNAEIDCPDCVPPPAIVR